MESQDTYTYPNRSSSRPAGKGQRRPGANNPYSEGDPLFRGYPPSPPDSPSPGRSDRYQRAGNHQGHPGPGDTYSESGYGARRAQNHSPYRGRRRDDHLQDDDYLSEGHASSTPRYSAQDPRVVEVKRLSAQISDLLRNQEGCKTHIKSLENRNEKLMAENRALCKNANSLGEENLSLKDHNKILAAKNRVLDRDVDSLDEENQSLKAKLQSLEGYNGALTANNRTLGKDVSRLEEEKRSLKAEIKFLKGKVRPLEDSNISLDEDNKALREARRTLEATVNKLNAERRQCDESYRGIINDLQRERDEHLKARNASQENRNTLENNLMFEHGCVQDLQGKNDSLRAQVWHFTQDRERVARQLSEAERERDDLRRRLRELEETSSKPLPGTMLPNGVSIHKKAGNRREFVKAKAKAKADTHTN